MIDRVVLASIAAILEVDRRIVVNFIIFLLFVANMMQIMLVNLFWEYSLVTCRNDGCHQLCYFPAFGIANVVDK